MHFLRLLIAWAVVWRVSITLSQLVLHLGHFIKNQTWVAWLQSGPKLPPTQGYIRLEGFAL